MNKILLAKSEAENKDLTKLLCDVLSIYSSYLMDDVTHNFVLNMLHAKDNPSLPFDVDSVYEHMYRLKDDIIDERNK
jgi:hypothetical protein